MSAAIQSPMMLAEFLQWEEQQDLRYEFDGFEPKAMVGETEAHSIICANIVAELTMRLRGKPCRAHGSSMRIEVAGRIRYPDAVVDCSPVQPGNTVLREPAVVFEVISQSTSNTDHFEKNTEYEATPSIARYIMLSQDPPAAEVYERREGRWVGGIVRGLDAVLLLPEIGVALPIGSLYEGLVPSR